MSTTELSTIDSLPEELQLKILEASKRIEASCFASLNKIRLDAKNYIFPDGTETNSFTGIIVNFKHANIHYPKEYQDGVINPPDCFAVGDAACTELKADASVEAKYCVTCKDCAKFQWKSAARGNGKACAEHTLLAVYIPQLGEDLYLLEEKKANCRAADAYLSLTKGKKGHPIFVYTSFHMAEKEKWAQTFYAQDFVPKELVTKLAERMEEAGNMLEQRVRDLYQRNIHTEEVKPEEPIREARKR